VCVCVCGGWGGGVMENSSGEEAVPQSVCVRFYSSVPFPLAGGQTD